MKGKRLLIVGAAVTLAIGGFAGVAINGKANALFATVSTVTLTPSNLLDDGMNGTRGTQTYSGDGLGITISDGICNSDQARIYKNATITFSAESITNIIFTCTAEGTNQYGPGCFATLDGYSYSGKTGTWAGSASSVSFTASSNQVRVTQFKITYDDGTVNKLATPQPDYSNGQVTWGNVENASSYDVTVDGGEPIHNATSPFDVSDLSKPAAHTVTVTAIGTGSYTDSNAASVKFALFTKAGTAQEPYDVENARAAIDGGNGVDGVYVTGIVSEIVEAYNSEYGNMSYNISANGTTEEDQLQVYRGKSFNGANFTSNYIKTASTVVVYGSLIKYGDTYEFSAGSTLISYVPDVLILDEPNASYSNGQITWEVDENASSYDVTVDGGEPIHNATSPFDVSDLSKPAIHTVVVTAVGNGNPYSNSDPKSVRFALFTKAGTAQEPYDVENARVAIDAGIGLTNVYATGIVSEIVAAYSSEYGNISYNISFDGLTTSDQLQAYRGKSFNGENFTSEEDIEVGATVVVYGTLKKYNSTYEFDANNQLVSYTAPAHDINFYLNKAASFVELSGNEISSLAAQNPVSLEINDLVEDKGYVVSSGSTINDIVKSFALDSNITVSTTGQDNCGTFWTNAQSGVTDWRLYQNKKGNLVITAASGCELSSVKITFTISSGGALLFNEEEVSSGAETILSGNSAEFVVGNSGSATNGQIRVSKIEVAYSKPVVSSVDSVAMRFGAKFAKNVWDNMAKTFAIKDYGVMLFKRLADSTQPTLTVKQAYEGGKTLATVRKGSGVAPYLDERSNEYVFNAKVNISSSNYNLMIVAASFVVIEDGEGNEQYIFLEQEEYSAKTLAQYHLTNGGTELSNEALSTIIAAAA